MKLFKKEILLLLSIVFLFVGIGLKRQISYKEFRCTLQGYISEEKAPECLPVVEKPIEVPRMAVSEVKRLVTTLEWSDGNRYWSRWLDFKDCTGDHCQMRSAFYSPQVCKPGTPKGTWCERPFWIGTIRFAPGGIWLKDEDDKDVFCELKKKPNWSNWHFEGPDCPDHMIGHTGREK